MMMREELFRLITENAADMIAVVGVGGREAIQQPLLRIESPDTPWQRCGFQFIEHSRGNGFLQTKLLEPVAAR